MLMFDRRKNYLTLLSPAIYLDDSEDDRDRELPPELNRPQGSLLPGTQSNMTLNWSPPAIKQTNHEETFATGLTSLKKCVRLLYQRA